MVFAPDQIGPADYYLFPIICWLMGCHDPSFYEAWQTPFLIDPYGDLITWVIIYKQQTFSHSPISGGLFTRLWGSCPFGLVLERPSFFMVVEFSCIQKGKIKIVYCQRVNRQLWDSYDINSIWGYSKQNIDDYCRLSFQTCQVDQNAPQNILCILCLLVYKVHHEKSCAVK